MTFRWWMAPAVGVGLVAVANAVLITAAVRVRPQKSEAQPYAASAQEDQRAAERAAFAARGWRLDAATDAAGTTLSLIAPAGPRPVAAQVAVFRPDDAAADRQAVWTDPSRPLRIDLPRPGAWSLRVRILDAEQAALAGDLRLVRP